ncbi:Glycosyltransferase family 9 (heptosyltransferase) [Candidatus Pelagibacter ubique HTCC1002]|uniref:Glycosyltransferase family 9 (Heptosyltransferase) n=1 Tax=Pelagibacter ubique (strain HTCC1002) TaxID=314261 RepID=Q1V0T2_PELU1|nr:glycosyltransferase family 9 protein [Candidatus Pelagibacter ubique]EAS85146.1 Glycosyltransferase family 9 (heptosyltransferase) [Candidatus Pelagibacter ubique HTCC1002]
MKTCIYLSYKGLGANLLHLAYCHEIAQKYGPVTIITLCHNLEATLKDDPLIDKIIFINKYHKRFIDILRLRNFFNSFNFDQIFIFYPSVRIYLASVLSNIKKVFCYPLFKKNKLHLVDAAKKFTEKSLGVTDCSTETNYFIKENKIQNIKKNIDTKKFTIVIGAGSSGPTTKWGAKNYSNLINKLNNNGDYYFFILCGPKDKDLSNEITNNIKSNNYVSLYDKKIEEVIPFLCSANMYVGNDSFGSHITAQSGIKSLVILLDSPKAYTDYSKNYHRIFPENIKIENITHGSNLNPNDVSVEKVYQEILNNKF